MGKNEQKPAIRFQGFTDAWEQRKVGDVIEDYIEKTTVQNQYPVLTSSQQQGIVLQEDYFADRQVTTNDNVGYYVLPRGYFTYRSRSDTDLFVFNRNNLIDKGIISYYYPVFRPKNADSNFLLRRLNHGIRSQLSMAAEGTGQHVLAHSKFKNMEFLVPPISEQKIIGAYFEKLDDLITLHQRKYDQLVNIKKSMLEKMFPRDGASVPEIRFSGFTDPWEQRKLGDLGSVSMCRRIFKHQTAETGDVPFYKIGTFGGTPDAFISRALFEDYKAKYPYPEKGDILISASGSIGRTVEFTGKNEYFQDSNIVWLKHDKSIINPFLRHLYEVVEWAGIEGSTIKRLYNDNILKTEIMLPSVAEQSKIAEMLDGIDDLITLHQRKLEKLKNIKKSMLEKMFV